MKTLAIPALFVLVLAGCTSVGADEPSQSTTAPAQITASEIVDIDDGIAWARGLDDAVTAPELSEGIGAVGALVPALDLWFQDNNTIGQNLISLNVDVLNDPGNAGSKVDDLNDIVDEIEASIAKGNVP